MNNKIILVLILFGIIFGCANDKPNGKSIILQESKNGLIIDTIFLDYYFGMTKSDFINHTKKLISEDKLISNEFKREVYYEFEEEFGDKLYAQFAPKFHLDSLHELVLYFKSKGLSAPELMKTQIANMYMKKYGSPSFEEENILDKSKNYVWIKGNLKILVGNGIDDARVWYTDLRKEVDIEELKDSTRSESIEKTKSEI